MSRTVCFGEILLRLSPPGRELLLQTSRLDMWVGGAEANVATGLAWLGHDVAMVSALPDNALGEAAVAALRGNGVDCGSVARRPGRMGLYFVTQGAGVRPTEVMYDRAESSFATAPVHLWDWAALLTGAGRLHLSGITPALGEEPAAAALAAATAASAAGVPVSFDGNFRSKLWAARAVDPVPILRSVVAHADILFGSRQDLAMLLDLQTVDSRQAAEAAFAAFPRLRMIATTERTITDADQQRLSCRIDTPAAAIEVPAVPLGTVVDRIGTGDAFATGVLHGLAVGTPTDAARYGLHLAALKHSLPGDASLFSRRDLEVFAEGRDVIR